MSIDSLCELLQLDLTDLRRRGVHVVDLAPVERLRRPEVVD